MKRIIAYALTDAEMLRINTTLKDILRTDSYLIGTVSDEEYKELQNEQFIIKVLSEEGKSQETADIFPESTFSKVEGYIKIRPSSIFERGFDDATFPNYFIVTLDTPLINDYKQELESLAIDIIRYLGNDSYVIYLKENVLNRVRELSFIQDLRYYGEDETGLNIFTKLKKNLSFNNLDFISDIANRGNLKGEMIQLTVPIGTPALFDVVLHRKEDRYELLKYLEENQVRVLGSSEIKVRIEIKTGEIIFAALAANKYIQTIEQYIQPKPTNDLARQILNVDGFGAPVVVQMDYEGEGQIIGIADTGIDDTHPALADRIAGISAWGRSGDSSDPNGHGTHVAGSIVGTGANSNQTIKGTAPKAKIFFQSILKGNGQLDLPVDLGQLFQEAFDAGARIHNNSWGAATKSRYTASSVEVDNFVYANKDMLLVFSAGNDGKGKIYRNVPEGYTDLFSLGSPATAKNALTVGASRSTRSVGGYSTLTYGTVWQESFPFDPTKGQKISGNPDCMAAFSSRGPVDDERRVKPDLVAPGTDIASTFSKDADLSNFCGIHPEFDKYAIMCGTSMSAPLVSGCAALAREYYQKNHSHLPSAALLKATLINSTSILKEADANFVRFSGTTQDVEIPHYHQGFGLLNMLNCIPGTHSNFKLAFEDGYLDPSMHFTKTGQRFSFNIQISNPCWLKITMVYTDPPARGLQHNLVLIASHPASGQKWAGNHILPRNLVVADGLTGVAIDLHNNVQTICLSEASPGSYTVQIVAHSLWQPSQDFAMVITSDDKDFIFTKH
ncbi:S8 family serine peptidase [Pedobacter borealis]|uniref:S8 family serine peptidase n=1 Tax=Pedobacter borealis TaxID=475254 RepID=UPI00049367D5|nr:S8 family serine peptidase [Pedobacter borealis]